MKILQTIFGILLMTLQLIILYVDRFIVAFLPHLEIKSIHKTLNDFKHVRPALIRVILVLAVYSITKLF